jgi:hypothetical protein
MAAKTSEKVACPECGERYVKGYIGSHLKKQHGVIGGLSGKPRASKNGKKPTFKTSSGRTFEEMEGFLLLTDDEGGMWLAEKIRDG